jgi:hypothetical protein
MSLLEKVDSAIRLNFEFVKIGSDEYSIDKFRVALKSILSIYISQAMKSLGDIRDVDHFFLSGGSSHLYRDSLKLQLGNRLLLETSGDPQFNNLRGFQIYCQQNV